MSLYTTLDDALSLKLPVKKGNLTNFRSQIILVFPSINKNCLKGDLIFSSVHSPHLPSNHTPAKNK